MKTVEAQAVFSFFKKDQYLHLICEYMFVYDKEEVIDMDRGNKLWEGHRMILPEYEEGLRLERKRKSVYRPPDLHPDVLENIERQIQHSYMDETPIVITYADTYGPRKICGYVMKINSTEQFILIQNGERQKRIPFALILDAEEPPEAE